MAVASRYERVSANGLSQSVRRVCPKCLTVSDPAHATIGTTLVPMTMGSWTVSVIATDTIGAQSSEHPLTLTVGPDEPPCIARVAPAVSGINQQRLPRGRHDERRLSALDIDEENLEVPGGGRSRQHEEQGKNERGALHEPVRSTIHFRRPGRQCGPD